MNEIFSNQEDAKKHIRKLVPLGYFDSGQKKIIGYTKYGIKEIGYRYRPSFKFVNSDGTLGRSKFELRNEDFEKYFKNRNLVLGLPENLRF